MSRHLYEHSISYQGYLIVPFLFGKVDSYEIYSYKLLSEIGRKSRLHKTENPGGIYGSSIDNIIDIAKEYINEHADFVSKKDSFKVRYIYSNNLIIIFQEDGSYFYDHYPPDSLNNIAAPKLFKSEYECLCWIKQGLDALHPKRR